MPIKQVTDPVTGKVTEVFEFGPAKAAAAQPAVKAKPAANPIAQTYDQIKGITEVLNPLAGLSQVSPELRAAGAGLQTLQKTGDLGKAFGAGTQSIVNDINKGTGAAGAIKRAKFRSVLTSAQETSDFVQEVGAKVLGKPSPTSFKKPDAPFLGVLPAIPRARSSGPAEDLLVGALQLGLGFVTGSAAAGVGGMAVRGAFSALPLASRLGVATTRLRAAKGFAEAVAPVAQIGAKISGAVQAGTKAAGPGVQAARLGMATTGARLTKDFPGIAGAAQAGAQAVGFGGQAIQAGAQAVGKSVAGQVIGKGAVIAGATDLVAFDQYGGRATDAVYELVKGTPFEPIALEYFRTNPNDVGLDGRLKNWLEGIGIGASLEIPFRLFKAVKSFQNYKTVADASKQLDKLKDPKVVEALDDVKNANDAFQNEVVKQTQTRPEEPGQQPSFTDELERPIARNVAEVDPTTLAIAPEVYQYKIAGAKTKTGVSGSLKESKEYNPELAGIISVYRNPKDGKTYVVNGHNRVQKALESGTAKVLVRYIQANSPEEARAIGALQNIAEGQGTAIDAAKFMRDMKAGPEALENYGVNLTGKIASRATPLARLPQNIFDQVSTGALTEDRAIALGSVKDLDETVINSVAARAEKGKWSADKITQAMQEAKFATASTPAAGGGMLPGFEDFFATSNFDQLLDVRTEAAKALREGVVALSSAARAGRQGVLEAAGNVIDVAGSQAAKATAQQAVNLFDRVTQYEGPVRALLNDLAAQITPKKKAAQVVKENLAQIRAAIDDEANGPRLPFEEPAPEAPRPQPVPVEPELPLTTEESSVVAPEAAPAPDSPERLTIDEFAAAANRGVIGPANAPDFQRIQRPEVSTRDDRPAGAQEGIDKANTLKGKTLTSADRDQINAAGDVNSNRILLDIDQGLNLGYKPDDLATFVVHNYMLRVDPTYKQLASNKKISFDELKLYWTPETTRAAYDDMQQRSAAFGKQSQPIAAPSAAEEIVDNVIAAVAPPKAEVTPQIQTPGTAKTELPDTRGRGQFFHGAASEIKQLDEGYYENANIYGQGFYVTDDLDTAGSYTKKNKRAITKAGGAPSQVIYQVKETQPVKFYDLDSYDVSPSILKTLEAASKYSDSVDRALNELDASLDMSLAQVMDEIRANSRSAEESRDTIQEVFEGIRETLEAEGYGGFTHVGGKLTKSKRQHKVRIYWDAANQIDLQKYDQPQVAVAPPKAGTPDEIRLAAAEKAGNTELAEQLRARIAANPLRSRGPELPELPKGAKKPPLTREEIEARIEEIDQLIADVESNKLNMQVDEPRTRALVAELTKDIRTVAGDEVAIRFNNAFMETKGGDVAWGYKPGETMKVGGEYDPIKDLIEVNNVELVSADVQRPELLRELVDKLEQSAYHEAFHRVQFNFLKPEELRVFNQFLAEFKLDIGSIADRTANARAGRPDLLPIEKAAVSFQTYAWARKNNLDPVQALLGSTRDELEASSGLQKAAFAVMDTLYDFIERVGNAFQGRGLISIKSIFEDAYSGKLAKRGELGSVVDEAGQAVPSELERLDLLQGMAMEYGNTRRGDLGLPPLRSSAERFIDEYENVKAKIASGEMTLEDLITNVVADRNVQPMQSPSGETAYVPDPETAAGASTAMRAWMDAGGTREEVSGLPILPDDIVRQEAERWLATHDYQANAVLAELEYRSSGLANAAQLQRALLLGHQLADYTNDKAAIIADQWLNSKYDPNVDRDAIRQELLAIYKHASDINTPVVKATRALGQLLRTPQIQRPQPGSIDFKNTIEEYKIDEILVNGAREEEAVPLPEYLSDKIDPAFNDALENNEFSPELDAMIDQIAYNLKATRDTPSFGPSYWGQINKASKIGLNGLVMYRSAQLLSSGLTFWGNTLNGVFRLIQMPLSQIVGAGLQGQFERAGYSAQIYGQYVRNLGNAFALAKESYKAGRTLYDIDNQSLDFLDQQVNKDQGELIPLTGPVVLPTTDKGFTVSTMPWIDIQDKTTWALAQKRLWQTATSPIRAQIAVDTLFKVLAGQSFEFVRNLPMGMDNAVAQGLERNSKEAMDYAQQYADAAVKQATRHATVEGRTILDAIMTSPHAQTAMRYATFTDDIDAQMEVRTFDRGMEIAKDKKLEGAKAEAWAREWADKKQDMPFFTKGPSVMPIVWQKLIDLHPAFSVLQPFNRTPADIIKSAIRMTPAAFFVDTAYRDLNSMDAMTRDRVIGDVAVGSSAIALAMVGLSAGIVEMTGGGPQEPAAKQKWRDSGKQAYSIRFGDTPWISYRVGEPFTTVFGAVADYFEIQGNLTKEQRENLGDALTMTVLGMVASGTLSKSYYQGFTEFYEAVAGNASLDIQPNSRSSWSRYLSRIVASLEPASSALRAGRRIDDRAVRTVEPGSFFSEVFDEIRNQTPGWSYGIPARVNWLTGDMIVQSGILGDAHLPPDNPWMAMAMQYLPWSPLQRGAEKSSIDPVAAEMASLHSKGANFRGPHAADYGGQLRLDPSEFADYSRTMATVTDPNFNTTVYQELDALIKSEFYQAQPITEPSSESLSGRAQLIDGVISKYKQLAQEVYLQTRPDLQLARLKKQTADNDVNYQLKYGLNPQQFQQEALR